MDKITIVTAFFTINRTNWNEYSRSNLKYIDYFRFWARIQNDLVIYTDRENAPRLTEIREQFHRSNTRIVILDDFRQVDAELYASIQKAAGYKLSRTFRLEPENPESWNPDYNYLMMLKTWCVSDAVARGYADGIAAWVDFGFNHGGKYYLHPEEFNFLWEYDFSDKIHIFTIHDLEPEIPPFEICRRMDTYIQGDLIVAPAHLWKDFWEIERTQMFALNRCGLMDDDQTVMLMSYYERPELFERHSSVWFSAFHDCGGGYLTVRQQVPGGIIEFMKKIKHWYAERRRLKKYSRMWFKILSHARTKR